MDVRRWTNRISAFPAMAFAVGALVMDLAVLLLPLYDGSSVFSSVLGEGYPLRTQVAYLLTLFSQAVAILIGLMLLRRSRAAMASGMFVGLLVIIGLRVISSVVTIDEWAWQTAVVVGLQAIECLLLFLAARVAKQQGT